MHRAKLTQLSSHSDASHLVSLLWQMTVQAMLVKVAKCSALRSDGGAVGSIMCSVQAGLSRQPSTRTSGHGHTHAEEAQSVQGDGKVQNHPQAMKANAMQPRKTTVMIGSRTYQSFVGAQHTELHQVLG